MHYYFGKTTDVENLKTAGGYYRAVAAVSSGTQATGLITFPGNPADTDQIALNGITFTFLTPSGSAPAEHEIEISENANNTRDNLLAALSNSNDPTITVATYAAQGANAITITYNTAGTVGNSFTLSTTSAEITLSGATLTGGTD